MPTVTVNFLGRFGNQVMQYLFARGYAEKYGCTLQTEPWIGQSIFEINDPLITSHFRRVSEIDLKDGETEVNIYGYAQSQRAITYTASQARKWLKLRSHIESAIAPHKAEKSLIAHRRTGDYIGYGYVQVSKSSYKTAAEKFGYDPESLKFVSDEQPVNDSTFSRMEFLPDFYTCMTAEVLFRGNSTFSWVAGLLGNGKVYSPVIDGLQGGQEHDCEFVEGNHKKFANLGFITDLHVPE